MSGPEAPQGITEPETLTYSRLLRFVSTMPCTNQLLWNHAFEALADSPKDEYYDQAYRELNKERAECGCVPCGARRKLSP